MRKIFEKSPKNGQQRKKKKEIMDRSVSMYSVNMHHVRVYIYTTILILVIVHFCVVFKILIKVRLSFYSNLELI